MTTAEPVHGDHLTRHGTPEHARVQPIIARLEADFPGWRVWRTTDAGSWWATRCGRDRMREPRTLAADTPDGLRIALRETRAGLKGERPAG